MIYGDIRSWPSMSPRPGHPVSKVRNQITGLHTINATKDTKRHINLSHLLLLGRARALCTDCEMVVDLHRTPLVRWRQSSRHCKAVRKAATFTWRQLEVHKQNRLRCGDERDRLRAGRTPHLADARGL